MDIKDLGFTQEEILQKVVDQVAERVLSTIGYDPDGEYDEDSRYLKSLNKAVQEKLASAISDIADKHVLPNIKKRIEEYTMQETNTWGEATGKQFTFIEYLIDRAEAWMKEPVNHEGKSKNMDSSYSWKSEQARVAWMIDKHLQYSIGRAMETALKNANSVIIDGLKTTIDIQLNKIHEKLKISVKI